MSFWASLQIHFLPFNLSVSFQPKILIPENLWCNHLRQLNLLCCTDFGTWKGIKSTEIDKNILNWHNTEICQFLRNTPASAWCLHSHEIYCWDPLDPGNMISSASFSAKNWTERKSNDKTIKTSNSNTGDKTSNLICF